MLLDGLISTNLVSDATGLALGSIATWTCGDHLIDLSTEGVLYLCLVAALVLASFVCSYVSHQWAVQTDSHRTSSQILSQGNAFAATTPTSLNESLIHHPNKDDGVPKSHIQLLVHDWCLHRNWKDLVIDSSP